MFFQFTATYVCVSHKIAETKRKFWKNFKTYARDRSYASLHRNMYWQTASQRFAEVLIGYSRDTLKKCIVMIVLVQASLLWLCVKEECMHAEVLSADAWVECSRNRKSSRSCVSVLFFFLFSCVYACVRLRSIFGMNEKLFGWFTVQRIVSLPLKHMFYKKIRVKIKSLKKHS